MHCPPVLIGFALFQIYELLTDDATGTPRNFVGHSMPPGRWTIPSLDLIENKVCAVLLNQESESGCAFLAFLAKGVGRVRP
jgi:hypothetical protein